VGDFNGDGKLDLAVTNVLFSSVSVLLGNGDGTFGAATNYGAGFTPLSVAVGDFNGDGKLDLAVANASDNTVSVLLGNGTGGFGAAINYAVASGPRSVEVGDFNGDGKLDLVVANRDSNSVSVLLGNGDGTFGAATNYTVGADPVSVAVGDFNGDGALDLAVPNAFSNNVSVLLDRAPLTRTTLASSSPSSAAYGQLVTLTANVSAVESASAAPAGIVTFKDGSTILGTGTLDSSGHAAFSTFALGTGYHALTAVYQGDPHHTTSTAPVLNLLVNQGATTTTLSASGDPWITGQPVTLTATVTEATPGFASPTGSVLFLDGTATIGAGTLSGGVATLTTAALGPGSHTISAVYPGDNNLTGSTATALTEVINNPAPVLNSLSTTAVVEGSGAFTLTLVGSGFLGSSTVKWNGTTLTVTAASSTQLQVTVPSALLTTVGTGQVSITNPGPGGGTSLPQTATIAAAPLTAFGRTLVVTGNKNFSGTVATFTSGNPAATPATFTAIITWDDGSTSKGTVSGTSVFTVSGTHTFGHFTNAHQITVTIFSMSGSTATVTDSVIDPPGPVDGIRTRVVLHDGRWLVEVFDAKTGRLRGTLHPFGPAAGRPRVVLRNLDGDGLDDLVILARVGDQLRKVVFDARNLHSLHLA
jgi:hypothetical protein